MAKQCEAKLRQRKAAEGLPTVGLAVLVGMFEERQQDFR